ncbi:MAG: phosphate ABC transporter substrate-binding protein [Coraliomargarita sp.]
MNFFRTSLSLACAFAGLVSTSLHAENIVIMGSDTIGSKMAVQLSEAFRAKMDSRNTPVSFEISSEGSVTALAALIDGHSDIGMFSRAPKNTEISRAEANGVKLTAITVAHDAIAIVVNAANPIESISLEELELIYSGDVTDWSSITPAYSGRISAYTRNTASGTYSILQEVAMSSRDYGEDTQKMAGNEHIASEVAKNAHGIGYVGLAYTLAPGLKVVPIDGKAPNRPDYPLGRKLSFLVDQSKPLKPMTNDFIGFTLSPEGQAIVSGVNFLPVY